MRMPRTGRWLVCLVGQNPMGIDYRASSRCMLLQGVQLATGHECSVKWLCVLVVCFLPDCNGFLVKAMHDPIRIGAPPAALQCHRRPHRSARTDDLQLPTWHPRGAAPAQNYIQT